MTQSSTNPTHPFELGLYTFVDGHIVKMDYQRELFEPLRVENVETFIASGNVIFETGAGGPARLEREVLLLSEMSCIKGHSKPQYRHEDSGSQACQSARC